MSKSDETARCYASRVDNRQGSMTRFAIYSMRAADGACVGDGLVGEEGRAMRSSISEMDGAGKMRNCDQAR